MILTESERPALEVKDTKTNVSILPLPSECIDDITINEAASNMIPQDADFLMNKDVLKHWAFFTVPDINTQHESPIHIPSFESEGRVIPIAGVTIPFGPGYLGRYITSKGVGPCGNKYEKHIKNNQPAQFRSQFTGFLTDSIGDTQETNRYLANGLRTSFSPASLVLNKEQLRKWIKRMYKSNNSASTFVINRFEEAVALNRPLIQEIRIAGTRCRLQSTQISNPNERIITDPDLDNQIILGIQNLQWEQINYPERFAEINYYSRTSPEQITESMHMFIHTHHLPERSAVYTWLAAFLTVDAKNILEFETKYPGHFISYVDRNSSYPAKDTDSSFLSYDFDHEIDTDSDPTSNREKLLKRAKKLFIQYAGLTHAMNGHTTDVYYYSELVEEMFKKIISPTPILES